MVESILYMNEIVDSIPFRRLFHEGHTKILIYTMPLCQFFFSSNTEDYIIDLEFYVYVRHA